MAYQIQRHMVLAPCNTNILIDLKQIFDLVKILLLYRVQPQSQRYQNKYGGIFYHFFDFIEENIIV